MILCDWCQSKKEVKLGIRLILQKSVFEEHQCLMGPVDLYPRCQEALQTGLAEFFSKLEKDAQDRLSRENP